MGALGLELPAVGKDTGSGCPTEFNAVGVVKGYNLRAFHLCALELRGLAVKGARDVAKVAAFFYCQFNLAGSHFVPFR